MTTNTTNICEHGNIFIPIIQIHVCELIVKHDRYSIHKQTTNKIIHYLAVINRNVTQMNVKQWQYTVWDHGDYQDTRYKIQDILFVLSCVQLHIFRTIHTYIKLNTYI